MSGMYRKKNHHQNEGPNFIELNPEYNVMYNELCKQARVWNASGQYWLGRDCENRAKCLLKGDVEGSKVIKNTEDLFFKTKKFKY